jgi:hypothetical protein
VVSWADGGAISPGGRLEIKLPKEVQEIHLGLVLAKQGEETVTGVNAAGRELPSEPGVMFIAGTNEEGWDGGALFLGTLVEGGAGHGAAAAAAGGDGDNGEVLVVIACQFKSLMPTTDVDGSVIHKSMLKSVLEKMAKVEEGWIKNGFLLMKSGAS